MSDASKIVEAAVAEAKAALKEIEGRQIVLTRDPKEASGARESVGGLHEGHRRKAAERAVDNILNNVPAMREALVEQVMAQL